MKKSLIFLTLFACLLATEALAQPPVPEVCNNGIDDDKDGLIDCFDADCVGNNSCDGFYIGNDGCSAVPPEFPQFSMALDFASPNETTNHIGRMAIGDMNNDGMPEIITLERYTKNLFILNGNDGTVRASTTVTFDPIWEIAIGNINNGNAGCAEAFFAGVEGSSIYFYAYDCNLNQLWSAKIRDNTSNNGDALDPINYGLADFDGDGKVELYAKDMIFDAHTGTRIINTATTTDNQWNNTNGGPVAVDMDNPSDGKLELVVGLKIYDITLGDRTTDAGTRTLRPGSPANYFARWPFNATSVADYNLDGSLDVIASGSDRDGSAGNAKRTTVFFWDVKNNVVKTFIDDNTSDYFPDGWNRGTGRINIADLDGDGKMNVSFVSGKYLYALDENLNKKWRITINEETSGHTGCTLFDFVGDGSSEIVYRDERFLYIIDGATGTKLSQQNCISRTQREYPIVADVDADGSTEICVVCGFNDQDAWDNFNNLNYSQNSQVRVFKSASEPWVPARRVWNQHGYFNVNVNNDLTIPRRQQNHNAVFSDRDCKDPDVVRDIRPLNSFLNQSPFLDSKGCPVYVAANLAFKDGVTVKPPTCPEVNFKVSFAITNLGDLAVSGQIPITFYTRNPFKYNAVKLNTIMITLNGLGNNDVFTLTDAEVTGIGSDSLYIVPNDFGTATTPYAKPNAKLVECGLPDYVGVKVEFLPAPIVATPTGFISCSPTATPKGSVTAYVPTSGGGQNTTDYTFSWSDGASVVSPADHTGVSYSGIPGGSYTVVARHKTLSCSTVSATVVVAETPVSYTVDITKVHAHDNCATPNGELKAEVKDANGVVQTPSNFTYEWYRDFVDPARKVSSGETAINLNGLPNPGQAYVVIITSKANGCNASKSIQLFDETVKPAITASAPNIACSASATTTATANSGGATAGFTFKWYNGAAVKPTPDATGDTYASLSGGKYTVTATNNTTQCTSAPFTITITQTTPPTVTASANATMTSCDPAQPNGAVTATAAAGSPGYTYEWFRGQNTLPANLVGNTSSVSGLSAGVYTVKVTDSKSCTITGEATVTSNVVNPTLNLTGTTDFTSCTLANGSATVNVAPPVGNTGFSFDWYNGTTASGTPLAEHGNILSGLNVGKYTVVARNTTTHCNTPPVTVEIKPDLPTLNINRTIIFYPNTCSSSDGIMQVDASATPANVNGFRFEWSGGNLPAGTLDDGVESSTKSGLISAIYNIKVTNRDNGCSQTKAMPLPLLDAQTLASVNATDVTTCIPGNEGSATLKLEPARNAPTGITYADYKILLYQGTSTLDPLYDTKFGTTDGVANGIPPADKSGNFTFSTLPPGTYMAIAIGDTPSLGNCPSDPQEIIIDDNTTTPVIVAADPAPINTYCGGLQGNAQIALDIDNGAPATDYTYVWAKFSDDMSSSGPITVGTTATPGVADGLIRGVYSVVVTNNTTQCEATANYPVVDNPPVVTLTAPGLELTNFSVCPPNLPNGAAEITKVLADGVEDTNLASYDFEWRNAPAAAPFDTDPSVTGLAAGTYYVTAVNDLNCSSSQVEFEIEDETINSVTVTLAGFIEPTQCAKPTNLTGELEVTPSGTLAGLYSVTWLQGSASGAPVVPQPAVDTKLDGITITSGTTITFGVEVENTTTNCKVTDQYTINLHKLPVVVSASAAAMTYCTNPFDGKLFAGVTTPEGFVNQYTYTWTNVSTNQTFAGNEITDVAAGDYTVKAVDNSDAACESQEVLVTVTEERIYPTVMAEALMPLTNCDMTRPNGIATASVVGGVTSDYIFAWYEGSGTGGTQVYADNAQADGLASILYTVHATDRVTGCDGTVEVTVPDATAPLPPGEIQVVKLQDVSTCAPLDPDGALSASVNGDVINYDFYWYNNNPGATPDITTADFSGREFYDSLATGTYYVSVVNRTTGCAGGPASGVIDANPLFPDFDFLTETASCKKNDTDPADGFISLVMKNMAEIDRVEWTYQGSGASVEVGPTLGNAEAGTYTVTVTTLQGCQASKDVLLKTDIRPFNGISRNNDGQNDTFVIKCLEEFPDNIVRIFNRAGTLVFEAEKYNNLDIYFDGVSNKGISLMGNNLPDGTYFYVIDKRDGSKPVAGYLEIVN